MAEDAGMLAEALAVVGGDDHPGRLQDAPAAQLVDQSAELLVEVRDAIVVGVADERDVLRRRARACPAATSSGSGRDSAAVARAGSEPVDAQLGELVGIVGVVEIQEGEERPLRLPAGDSQSRNSRLTAAAVLAIGVEQPARGAAPRGRRGRCPSRSRRNCPTAWSPATVRSTRAAGLKAVSLGKM